MKVLVLVILSLLVSCNSSITPNSKKDSILNYRGATIVTKGIGLGGCYIFRVRIYDRHTKQYIIKRVEVYDGRDYKVGEIIK